MQDTEDNSTPRPSGRPQSIDPEAVAKLALNLFKEQGYTSVSMAQIADEAGIARKSLYRYFSSKADLVWGGLSEASVISAKALEEAAKSHETRRAALEAATDAAYRSLPDLEVTRGRLRLIGEQPDLIAQAPVRMDEQNKHIYAYLIGEGLKEHDAHYVSVAYGSLTFAAWIRWAQSDEPSPVPFLKRAMRVLQVPVD